MLTATPIPIARRGRRRRTARATLTPGISVCSRPGAAASGATASTITTAVTTNAPISPRRIVRAGARELATEEQRQAAADVQQRGLRARLGERAGGGAGAERRRRRRDVRERDAVEDAREHELPGGDQRRARSASRRARRSSRRRSRPGSAARAPSGTRRSPGSDLGEQVVDDLDGRVHEVQPVAERPDRGLHERDAAARGRLDERVQAAGAVICRE